MGLLLSLLLVSGLSAAEKGIVGIMIAIMILFGSTMWYFGVRAARRAREAATPGA
jgi:type IV secretory pathway TrbD component